MARVKKDNANGNTKPRLLLVVSDDLIREIFTQLFERSGLSNSRGREGKRWIGDS